MDLDLTTWDKRNLAILPSGEVAVRPGLRKVLEPPTGYDIVDGFSAVVPTTEDTWHYITVASSTGTADVKIYVYDEDFDLFQIYTVGASSRPRVVSHAVVNGQVVITSPDFAAVWGVVGGNLQAHRNKQSITPDVIEIAPPRGICVSWGGRLVIASDNAVYFSDAGEPRTFAAGNVAIGEWSGRIYGLSVTSQRVLVVAAQDGVHALPFDAAQAGQFVDGDLWTKQNDIATLSYDSIVSARGRTHVITRRGVRQVIPDGEEMFISEQSIPRFYGPRVDYNDYRFGRIYSGQCGMWLSVDDLLWHHDEQSGFWSWWDNPSEAEFRIRGLLEIDNGEEMLVSEAGVFRIFGNFDGTEALTSEDNGTYLAEVETDVAAGGTTVTVDSLSIIIPGQMVEFRDSAGTTLTDAGPYLVVSADYINDTFVVSPVLEAITDGDLIYTSPPTVRGVFAGRINSVPASATKIHRTDFASDTGGDITQTLQGRRKISKPPQAEESPRLRDGILIGTDSWGDGNYYIEPRLRSREEQWRIGRSDESSMEFSADNPLSRVSTVASVDIRGPGESRRTS